MIDLGKIADCCGERTFIRENGKCLTFAEFFECVKEAGQELATAEARGKPLPLSMDWSAASIARLIAAWDNGLDVALESESLEGDWTPFLPFRPLLVLRTGGTTGAARHVVHSLDRFLSRYSFKERPPVRILPLYAADHIAGLDAILQALQRGSTLVLPQDRSPIGFARALEADGVEVLAGTPTFLQFLLLSGALEDIDASSVKVIPHGAEPMPEAVRSRIQKAFPNARMRQRFGLTELGALPVIEDTDDPSALKLIPGKGLAWKIEAGELLIQSESRMLGTLEDGLLAEEDNWYRTGDLAEETNDGYIRILGRRESLINVGGMKVIPEKVEALLLDQAKVLDAAVFSQPNPLTGEAVCAEVVFAGPPDALALLRALRRAAREKGLPLAYVPTRIEGVEEIAKSASGKRLRSRLNS